ALGEYAYLPVEQGERGPNDGDGDDATSHALKGAKVVKGPPDEGLGCTDQLRNLDFVALREDLQPDRVEGDRHQGKPKEEGEEPQAEPADGGQRRESPRPRRIRLHVRDTRQLCEVRDQGIETAVTRRHYIRVRQR